MKSILGPRPLTSVTTVFIIFLFCLVAKSQESIRTIDKPGNFNKYLTPNTVDRWFFDGFKNETIIAHVQTREFDSTVQLVQTVDGKEKILKEIDDDGSNCWLSYRLPEDGEYKICVRGYESKGGGNYSLKLQQFEASPMKIGKAVSGRFDRNRNAYFYFDAAAFQFATVDVKGFATHRWTVLDTQGKPIAPWHRMAGFLKAGEYIVHLQGSPGSSFELKLHPVEISQWQDGENTTGTIKPRTAKVVHIDGRVNDFRMIEFKTDGTMKADVVYAPDTEEKKKRIQRNRSRKEIVFVPVGSKGRYVRYAMIFGRTDRFQIRLFSEKDCSYESSFADPSEPIRRDEDVKSDLGVGQTRFFKLDIDQGQSVTVDLGSEQFDSVAGLYNSQGYVIRKDDDGGREFDSNLKYKSYKKETLLLSVSSVGYGGGGDFAIKVNTQPPKPFDFKSKVSGQMGSGGTDQYVVSGKRGNTLIFHVVGKTSRPYISLRNGQGVEIAKANSQVNSSNAVLAYRPNKEEEYTLIVGLPNGGQYEIQGFKAD